MTTARIHSLVTPTQRSGLRPLAAVCALALAALGASACSGRIASQAPLAPNPEPASAGNGPLAGSDWLPPPAAQVLKARRFDDGEPVPTF